MPRSGVEEMVAIWPVFLASFKVLNGDHLVMTRAAAEFDDDDEAKAWLVEKIAAALEGAEEAGYKRAMAKRF